MLPDRQSHTDKKSETCNNGYRKDSKVLFHFFSHTQKSPLHHIKNIYSKSVCVHWTSCNVGPPHERLATSSRLKMTKMAWYHRHCYNYVHFSVSCTNTIHTYISEPWRQNKHQKCHTHLRVHVTVCKKKLNQITFNAHKTQKPDSYKNTHTQCKIFTNS